MGILSTRQNVIWLGVSELTLHFMSCTCKGYTTTPEIKAIVSNVKQKGLLMMKNVEKDSE